MALEAPTEPALTIRDLSKTFNKNPGALCRRPRRCLPVIAEGDSTSIKVHALLEQKGQGRSR